jgi:hypothetical protein
MCLANYGASEAIYLCNVVEKTHQYFRPKNAPMFLENKISRSLTTVGARYLPVSTVHPFFSISVSAHDE